MMWCHTIDRHSGWCQGKPQPSPSGRCTHLSSALTRALLARPPALPDVLRLTSTSSAAMREANL
jgi:hypothetical protein